MPLESDKQIRVDKIRNPARAYRLSGVFRAVLFFNAAARRCPLDVRRPRHTFTRRGLWDVTARAH